MGREVHDSLAKMPGQPVVSQRDIKDFGTASIILRFVFLWLALVLTPATAATLVPKFTYVTHFVSNGVNHDSISVYTIDTSNGALSPGTAVSWGAAGPWSIAADPTGRFVYVTSISSNTVSAYAINPNTGALTAGTVVATGDRPIAIAVAPAGKFAYVANENSNTVSVYAINASTGALTNVATVATGSRPNAIAIDPTGNFAYVPNVDSDTVSVYAINASTGALTAGASVATGSRPYSIGIDPAGKFVYVTNVGSDTVSVYAINSSTGALTTGNSVATGSGPNAIKIDPTGKFAYVTNGASNTISVYTINVSTGALTAGTPVATGSGPVAIEVDPSGKFAYVAHNSLSWVSVYKINTSTGALSAGAAAAPPGVRVISIAGSISLPVAPAITAVASPSVGHATVSFSAPYNGGSDITAYTVTSSPEGIRAIGTTSPILVAGLAGGSYTFTVTATNTVGESAPSVPSAAVTVRMPQTIGMIGLSPATLVTGANASISASATSGLPVSFSSTTPSICTVTGSTVTAIATGTCSLAANQTGSVAYGAAAQVLQSFVVKAQQTITFDAALDALLLKATSSAGLPVSFTSTTPSICTVAGNLLTPLQGGTCSVTADQPGNADYGPAAQVTRTFTMAAQALSLTPSSVAFATLKVGAVGTPQRITVTNPGIPVAISRIAASGDFVVDSDCGTQLGGGSSCSIDIVFVPIYPGTHNGTLTVASNAAGNLNTISLNGTATLEILSYPLSLEAGWNLLGNSINKVLNVSRLFGDASIVTTVWKWNAASAGWEFYTPQMSSTDLQAYASGKGYGVLAEITPGEGYWVNAKIKTSLASPSAAPYERMAGNLVSGWNLVGTGFDVSPATLNASLASVDPSVTITTLWAWDSSQARWYFYAPSLDAQGAGVLASYVTSKGYLDFAATGKSLGKGTGFWINANSQRIYPPHITTGVAATGAPCGTDDATLPTRAVVCNYCGTAAPDCTEPNVDGKFSLMQAAADTLACVYKQGVKPTLFGRAVTNLGDAIGNVVKAACRVGDKVTRLASITKVSTDVKKTQNVNKITDTVYKVVDAEARNEEAAAGEIEVSEFPPPFRKIEQATLDSACQGKKSMLGLLGQLIGSDCTVKDAGYKADSAYPADHAQDLYDVEVDGAGSIVSIRDKAGNVMASAPTAKIISNTVSGDPETVTQVERDAAQAIATTIANCLPPNTVQSGRCVSPPPVNCAVSDWSLWGSCSANCGGGAQTRTRTILTQPANGGLTCPALSEQQSCNAKACVIGVTGTWSYTMTTQNFTHSACTRFNGVSQGTMTLTEQASGYVERDSDGSYTGTRTQTTLSMTRHDATFGDRPATWVWDGANRMSGNFPGICFSGSTITEEHPRPFTATRQ